TCTIAAVSQSLGPTAVAANFAGNGYYFPASAASSVLVYSALASGGAFVIGKGTASIGGGVTYWGSQWASLNVTSAPSGFKGFAAVPALPSCGAGFTAASGSSSTPPGSVPAYMAVIASSSVTQAGSTITGDSPRIVIVKTAPGYAPSPGHAGTGTVVAVLC